MRIRVDNAAIEFDPAATDNPTVSEASGFTFASTDARDEEASENVQMLHPAIPAGLTVILGAAGSGKTTMITTLAARLREAGKHTILVPVNEPDYPDAAEPGTDGNRAIVQALATALRAKRRGETPVVFIDSLRHLTMLGTGYGSRLGRSGFDLTMFQAMSDLDRVSKRLGIHVVASVFLNTFQLSSGDASDSAALNSLMTTIALDMDGCVEATVRLKFGPEPGHYVMTARTLRNQQWSGRLQLVNPVTSVESTEPAPWLLSVGSQFIFDARFVEHRAKQMSNDSELRLETPSVIREKLAVIQRTNNPEISQPASVDRATLESMMRDSEANS